MSEPNAPMDRTKKSPPRPGVASSNSTIDANPASTDPNSTAIAKPAASKDRMAAELPARLGRFEVRAVLGEGAFGRVYRGFDPELQREIAIKVPHAAGMTAGFRERFLVEARAAATIHHPNVCPVHEVGTDGDLPYLVMHFVHGRTLAAVLAQRKSPFPPRHAAAIARKLALGVAAAHARGVIHRDLKPANILVDEANWEVLITDFGLARLSGEAGSSVQGDVMGTPAYMSPEQARGDVDTIGPLSDVYALGVILYQMLAGEIPYRGTVHEVLAQVRRGDPRPPSAIRPELDPWLDVLFLKATAKSPNRRYPSAKEFANALTDYLRASKSTEPVGHFPTVARVESNIEAPNEPAAASSPPSEPEQFKLPPMEVLFIDGLPVPQEQTPAPRDRPRRKRPKCAAQPDRIRTRAMFKVVAITMVLVGATATLLLLLKTTHDPKAGSAANLTTAPISPANPAAPKKASPADTPPSGQKAPERLVPPTTEPLVASTPKPEVAVPPPQYRVLPVNEVLLKAGGSASVEIRVERNGVLGPITVELQGLPEGVTPERTAIVIPAGQDVASATLTAKRTATPRSRFLAFVVDSTPKRANVAVPITIQKLEARELVFEDTFDEKITKAKTVRLDETNFKNGALIGTLSPKGTTWKNGGVDFPDRWLPSGDYECVIRARFVLTQKSWAWLRLDIDKTTPRSEKATWARDQLDWSFTSNGSTQSQMLRTGADSEKLKPAPFTAVWSGDKPINPLVFNKLTFILKGERGTWMVNDQLIKQQDVHLNGRGEDLPNVNYRFGLYLHQDDPKTPASFELDYVRIWRLNPQ